MTENERLRALLRDANRWLEPTTPETLQRNITDALRASTGSAALMPPDDAVLDRAEESLNREHHSSWTWAHTALSTLVHGCRYLKEHLNNAERDRDAALERIGKLEAAIRKVIKHQPWPSTDRADRDFNEAAMLVPEDF